MIDRNDPKCLTPRRNKTVDSALQACAELHGFMLGLRELYTTTLAIDALDASDDANRAGKPLSPYEGGFVPVVPLFQRPTTGEAAVALSPPEPPSSELSTLHLAAPVATDDA